MAKYRVMMHYSNGTSEMDDEIFETEEAAAEHGSYMCACVEQGAEDLLSLIHIFSATGSVSSPPQKPLSRMYL